MITEIRRGMVQVCPSGSCLRAGSRYFVADSFQPLPPPFQVGLDVVAFRPFVPCRQEDQPVVTGLIVHAPERLPEKATEQLGRRVGEDQAVHTRAWRVVPVR